MQLGTFNKLSNWKQMSQFATIVALCILLIIVHSTKVSGDRLTTIGPHEMMGVEQDGMFCFHLCPQPYAYHKVAIQGFEEPFSQIKQVICPGSVSSNCVCQDMLDHHAETIGPDQVHAQATQALEAVCAAAGSGAPPPPAGEQPPPPQGEQPPPEEQQPPPEEQAPQDQAPPQEEYPQDQAPPQDQSQEQAPYEEAPMPDQLPEQPPMDGQLPEGLPEMPQLPV